MSGKPENKANGQEDDILEQVISQGLSKLDPSAREAPAGETFSAPEQNPEEKVPPPEKNPEEKAPPPETKNKRSSVYIYLLVLFGAAFMMLLLAYFVQQRNSESTISDLRNSMNLSREEMMEEIEGLEKDKETLNTTIEGLRSNVIKQGDRIEELKKEAKDRSQAADRLLWDKISTDALYWLERFCAEEDYLMAAVIVDEEDYRFNENNESNNSWPEEFYSNPIQISRYLELREQLEEGGYVLVTLSYTAEAGSPLGGKVLMRDMQPGNAIQEGIDAITNTGAAGYLWDILRAYSQYQYAAAADLIVNGSGPTFEALNSGAFPTYTRELFDQITADLIDRGSIKVNEDGTMSLPLLYGSENGDENDPVPTLDDLALFKSD